MHIAPINIFISMKIFKFLMLFTDRRKRREISKTDDMTLKRRKIKLKTWFCHSKMPPWSPMKGGSKTKKWTHCLLTEEHYIKNLQIAKEMSQCIS